VHVEHGVEVGSDIFTMVESRTMPALLTRMSSRPKVSIACCTISPAPSKSATFS
jgi:hypothetical protein